MNLQRLRIVLKTQIHHRKQNIFPSNRLPLLQLTFLSGFGCYERDEF